MAKFVFVTGAAIGGMGAGILWTSQGSYYTINAEIYSRLSFLPEVLVLNNFAAIFSIFYLSFETGFKVLATLVFYYNEKEDNGPSYSWRPVVFGLYTVSAFIAVVSFYLFTDSFQRTMRDGDKAVVGAPILHPIHANNHNINQDEDYIDNSNTSQQILFKEHPKTLTYHDYGRIFLQESLAVSRGFYSSRILRLLIPYQVGFTCF
jgi:hypothetical protein